MPSILFISTADQVRGPLAVALLSQMAQPAWGWQISSAGLQAAAGGQPVNRLVWRTMHARGLDHFLQPSRPVTPQVLKAADLILVMERDHRLWLAFGFPDWAGEAAQIDPASLAGPATRTHLFSEMFGSQAQAEDDVICRENPTIQDIVVAAENLEELLKRSIPRMHALLGSKS